MNNPLLTISIPTYNRAELLDACLANLLAQVQEVTQPIELIISNNASTDHTRQIAHAYETKFAQFRYVENDMNMGADANIAQAFRLATGQYVWVFSDDDTLLPGYLKSVVELLHTQQPGVLHLSSVWYNGAQMPSYDVLPFRYTEYAEGLKFIDKVHHWTTFITGNIIDKMLVANLPCLYAFPDTNLIQLGWVLPAIFKARQNIVVDTPIIAGRAGNTGGFKFFKTFSTNISQILDNLIQNKFIPAAAKRIISWHLLDSQFPYFLNSTNFGKKGSYNSEPIFRTLFVNYWRYPTFWTNIALVYLKQPIRPAYHWLKASIRGGSPK